MQFFAFLLAAIVPLAKKLLFGLGIGIMIYTGLQPMKDQLQQLVNEQLGQMGQNVYAIAAMAGFIDAIGVWLAAITTVMSMVTMRKMGLLRNLM